MKPSTVAHLVALFIAATNFALYIANIQPVHNILITIAMFLCTSLICRAIEEYRK